MFSSYKRSLLAAAATGLALVLTACSSSTPGAESASSTSSAGASPSSASAAESVSASASASVSASASASVSADSSTNSADPTEPSDGPFPVTIEHKYGSTTIPAKPERVVAVGFNEQDFTLALGVVPVGAREFFGYDYQNRPWAQNALDGAAPVNVGAQEMDYEAISALKPDLILGIYSYMDDVAYKTLSGIAPTVAQTDAYPDGGTPWQEQLMMTGEALGLSEEAADVVTEVETAFTDAAAANPEFAGKTLSVGMALEAQLYSVGLDDVRSHMFRELGFTVPEASSEVSPEELDTAFNTDVLVTFGSTKDMLQSNQFFTALTPVVDDKTAYLGPFTSHFAAAVGFNSPLSLPYALEIALPRLIAASDGDPSTIPEEYV